MPKRRIGLFFPLALALLFADCSTKRLAEEHLAVGVPESIVGEVVRFTLGYNPGAAFGVRVGSYSRVFFLVIATAAIPLLYWMYRRTRPGQTPQAVAFALLAGGAAGNAFDRLISPAGVVDFIDIGIGSYRFWTFNVADAGITIAAVILLSFAVIADRKADTQAS